MHAGDPPHYSRTLPLLFLGALLCLIPRLSSAHPLPLSSITVNIEQRTTRFTVVVHVSHLSGGTPGTVIPARLRLRLDGAACRPAVTSITWDEGGQTVTWEGHEARTASAVTVDAPLFPDDPADSTVVVVYRGGRLVDKAVVDRESPNAILAETTASSARRFIGLGIHHILSGPDHVIFVLGLLLISGTLRELLAVVTAFTIAHSITLSMTALRIGSLPPWLVEPVIALSIVAIGVENVVSRNVHFERRVWLAFGFGFFHGFGFAGTLAEAGLRHDAIFWSLAAFNTGVEIGQSFIVLLVLPLLRMFGRLSPVLTDSAVRYASVGIAASGLLWFVERLRS